MILRTARQGQHTGSQFWGCSTYPQCSGLIPLGEEQVAPQRTPMTVPVNWTEGVSRRRYNYEYISTGSVPGILIDQVSQMSKDNKLKRLLSHTLLLTSKGREHGEATGHARLISGLLAKLLQRGYTPLSTLEIERTALKRYGLIDAAEDLADGKVEVGWQLPPEKIRGDCLGELTAELIGREQFILDSELQQSLLQSDTEVEFLTEWVPSNLGLSAGHWFMPQAPLDTLLESATLEQGAARRIDFLVCHPGGEPFAIEIDGPEHRAAQSIDDERDKDLRSIGIDVIRVSNEEVTAGQGPQLEKIKGRFMATRDLSHGAGPEGDIAKLAVDCSIASKIQFAITRAISAGWLKGNEWEIDLSGAGEVETAGVLDTLRLLYCFDTLYGGQSVPDRCTVRNIGGASITWILVDGDWKEADGPEAKGDHLSILVERTSSPFNEIACDTGHDFIIRPAFLPVNLAVEQQFEPSRRSISPESYEHAEPALTTFLRTIFRKYKFRQQQGEAVFNTLRQNDSVVLLPTGAGKSIIYQLAGLLMPGMTIVVDPIIALIEDQVEGLQKHGIDRAIGIVSGMERREDRARLLRQIERGEYQFVLHSPERLQTPSFRGTLQALRQISLVNLAVIDEAHCVSEWGHDFRPAYLKLAHNLRMLAVDSSGEPPPLLALTGTASRAVLRDMLSDLEIDTSDSRALIRPDSFDRRELSFDIRRATVAQEAQDILRGVLNLMPRRFGIGSAQFYRPNGKDTASGIVFTRTINSRFTGLIPTMEEVRKTTKSQPVIYSGSAPQGYDPDRWERQKRDNAAAFKNNEAPILVSTKAFGMGIDKPNIRYIVHFGIPGSLESFYQEAGRAGRDQRPAYCITVFIEYDADRSDRLLDPSIGLAELRKRFDAASHDASTRDDITSALYFHNNTFIGSQCEVQVIESVLSTIGNLDSRRRSPLSWQGDTDKRRKEHAVVRLLRLGVISDYEVDSGAKKFTIQSERFEFGRCRQNLLEYVQAAQPHRSNDFAEKLSAIVPGDARKDALDLTRLLIEFTYDVIEKSRRRMIQESVLLARSALTDAEIRARLLDYLQGGLGFERIISLLDQRDVQLGKWWKLIETIQTPLDAGELRGLCVRLLESYPDHPGLLLTRAVVETMCSDHNDSASWQGIKAAIEACVKYRVPENDTRDIINKLYSLAQVSGRAGNLGVPLTMALLDVGETGPELAFCAEIAENLAPGLASSQEAVGVILDVSRLLRSAGIAEAVTGMTIRRYGRPSVTELLGGYTK